jgi:ferredoxin
MSTQRMIIDWTLCDGHGLCSRLWPERIGRDPWGYPLLSEKNSTVIRESEIEDARRVVSICPRLALRLETESASRPAQQKTPQRVGASVRD